MMGLVNNAFALAAPPPPGGVRGWLWRWFGGPVVCHSFHNWYVLRRKLLTLFGAKLDPTARIRPGFRIDYPWNLTMARKASIGDDCTFFAAAPITLGERSVVSQYCVITTVRIDDAPQHDPAAPRTAHVAGVEVGPDAWVATECLVTSGSCVPRGTVVGARSVVHGPLDPWMIASGDPAVGRAPRPYSGERNAP